MSSASHDWSVEEVDFLKERRALKISVGTIAGEMGLTRNAVAGKIHRLQLPKLTPAERPKAINFRFSARPVLRFMSPPKPNPAPPKPKPVRAACRPVHFLKLRDHHCRAIVGQARDEYRMYCGETVTPTKSWCAFHFAQFTQPPQPPKEKRHG